MTHPLRYFVNSVASYLCYLMLTCRHCNDATHSSRYPPTLAPATPIQRPLAAATGAEPEAEASSLDAVLSLNPGPLIHAINTTNVHFKGLSIEYGRGWGAVFTNCVNCSVSNVRWGVFLSFWFVCFSPPNTPSLLAAHSFF